ncbi:hypothetical protein ABPG72_014088 [Tetrahymena utriculariae]
MKGIKRITKENNFNIGQTLHLLCYEILFGIVWNIVWGNIFYKYYFLNTDCLYLKIWTSSIIIYSFVSSFAYLLIIYFFVKYTKEKNEKNFNIVVLVNQIWNCICCVSNLLLILISFNEYYFTEKFANHGYLSQTIKYYLLVIGVTVLLAAISAAILFLSCLFLSKFEAQNEYHTYQLIHQNEINSQIEQAEQLYE